MKGEKLKREDYPYLTDEQFELAQKINEIDEEGLNF